RHAARVPRCPAARDPRRCLGALRPGRPRHCAWTRDAGWVAGRPGHRSSARRRAAARFALEDQVASAAAESAIAVAPAREGGPVLAAVVVDALIRAIAAHPKRFARIIPEPALAPYGDGW